MGTSGTKPVYGLYGLRLASDFLFSSALPEVGGEPELAFDLVEEPPVTGWEKEAPAFSSSPQLDGVEESLVHVFRQDDYYVLRLTGIADYYLWSDRIACHLLNESYAYLVEIHLLGAAFSLWLELRGIPALHAAAVAVGGRAVGFLATNKGGKSSLAATLMREGHPLLTDDILPVEPRGEAFVARPGYPQMRMWPEQALHFVGHYEGLDTVHPAYSKRRVCVSGNFCDETSPLSCLYLPERRTPEEWGERVEFSPVPSVEALMALIGESFIPHTVEGLGLQPQRLSLFARLLSQIPVRRVVYPEGFHYLPRVQKALLDDLSGLSVYEAAG